MAHEETEVTVELVLVANDGPAALNRLRTKMQNLAPGRHWVLRSLHVDASGPPDENGEHAGPPWLFQIVVSLHVPTPDSGP
jgi:hypothetical protein